MTNCDFEKESGVGVTAPKYLTIFHKSHNLETFYSSPKEKLVRLQVLPLQIHHSHMFLFSLQFIVSKFLYPLKTSFSIHWHRNLISTKQRKTK